MKNWRVIAILLLCLVLGGVIVWRLFVDNEQEVGPQLFEIVRGDLTISVSGSGNIEISNEASLAFAVGGRVDKIYVKEADKVSKGDVLAKLDTDALEVALTQAQVAQERAKVAWERTKSRLQLSVRGELRMAEGGELRTAETRPTAALGIEILYRVPLRVDDLELELAKSEYEAAKQTVAQAQKQLNEATLTASFDGVVASVDAEEKDTVSTVTTIVHLIDPTSIELKVAMWERDIPMIRLNQRAIIEVDALPGVQLKGWVTRIYPVPTVKAGVVTYSVIIDIDIPEGSELKVGMSAEADIVIDERSNVLLVPNRAIKQDAQGNQIVKVMVNEQIKERPVVISISDGFQAEIVDGLSEGEMVVVER